MSTNNSESMEMYLKSVAELGGARSPVPIGRVADRMGVTSVSANEMMKRLAGQGMINHLPYKGVVLTSDGLRLANNVIRRQRLWECFLVDKLALDWAKSHELACDLEHATAVEVADALAEYLGNPTHCPHGNPIPAHDSDIHPEYGIPLSTLTVGQTGRVSALQPGDEEVLAYLYQRQIVPGKTITVVEAAPLDGPITLQLEDTQVILGLNLAALVFVEA